MSRLAFAVAAVLTLAVSSLAHAIPAEAPSAELVKQWGSADLVVVGTLGEVVAGPVAKSLPPIYSHRLTITVTDVLRGEAKPGAAIVAHHSARQHERPTFPEGKRVAVAIKKARGGMSVQRIVEADDKMIASVRYACSLPVGWTVVDGALRSPWAHLGKKGWVGQDEAPDGTWVCSQTHRPAYTLPKGVGLSVEPVPPAKEIKWTNPDGDGQYKITLTNTTDKPIEVQAVRRVGQRVLWNESIVVLCQGRAYTVPGSAGVTVKTEPLTLKPGQSVSHVVNALTLDGPEWPRGGYRIEFTFAIGDKSATQSFYYMSRHHDGLRAKARAALKAGG